MKKYLIIFLFVIMNISTANAFKSLAGKGDLQLQPKVVYHFLKYYNTKGSLSFIVSQDGIWANYGICPSNNCKGGKGSVKNIITSCEVATQTKCYIFARKRDLDRVIVWNKENFKIKPNLSNDKVTIALYELGFINRNNLAELGFTDKNFPKKNKKKSKKKKIDLKKLVKKKDNKKENKITEKQAKQLEVLDDLYKSGALTKDELNVAKDKVLKQ